MDMALHLLMVVHWLNLSFSMLVAKIRAGLWWRKPQILSADRAVFVSFEISVRE
jgi:hypothetical protein